MPRFTLGMKERVLSANLFALSTHLNVYFRNLAIFTRPVFLSTLSMDTSPSSGINNRRLFLPSLQPKNFKRQGHFNVAVSCRATTVSTERGEMVKYYNALSLGLKADIDEIKNAYRKMARYYHPGVCNPSKREESTRMFVELHDAYRTLLDQNLENEETCSTERMSRGRLTRETWESQLFELGNLSRQQKEQKQETWGSRLRSQCKHVR